MKELKPLLRDDASDFERQLLNAVRREHPSPQLQARMRGTLGLTGPVAWLGAARAALATVAGKSAVGLAAVVVVGVAAAGAVSWSGNVELAPPAAAPVSVAAPAAAEVPPAVAPEPPAERALAASQAAAEDPSARQLREEILLLDQARTALQRGSRAAALRELERYAERFPEGILSREATQLRQQARQQGPARGRR